MTCVIRLQKLLFGYAPLMSIPKTFHLFWHAASLPSTKPQGYVPLAFARQCDASLPKLSYLRIIGNDIIETAVCLQLCAGQPSGCEAAVHALRRCFENNDVKAVLLVDTSNAFNSLNRQCALHNIQRLCPPLATILINTYR